MPSPFVLASEEDVLARLRTIENEIDSEQDAGFRAALINERLSYWETMRTRVSSWMVDGDDATPPPMTPVFNTAQCGRVLDMLRARLRKIDATIRMRLIVNGFGESQRTAAE